MKSLRRSALLWTTALLAGVGLIAFAIAYDLARRESGDFLDGQLRQIALNAGDGLKDVVAPGKRADPEDQFLIMIWNAADEPLRRSKAAVELPRAWQQGFATVRASGEDWRVYMVGDGQRFVQVAQRMGVREEMARTAAIQAGAPILIVIPLAWLVIGWSLRRVLGSLSTISRAIAERGIDNKEQIPAADAPAELRPLIDAMNVLASRLQHALAAQRRFVSDAAHELRTPLAALRIQISNLRDQARDDQMAVVDDLEAGIRRATALVQQLLRLAREDEAVAPAASEAVELTDLAKQCIADFVTLAAAKDIDIGIGETAAASWRGSSADFATLVGNVLDNAIRYAPEGGTVDVSVQSSESGPGIEVLDTGPGVAKSELPRLFDRFHRAAPAGCEGNGLGLAIAASIAKRYGLTIDVTNRPDRSGLRVTIRQGADRPTPLAAPPSGPGQDHTLS
ncbi:MAG TPA: ATP-binding protein [Roseiarcus sp.]|nr:ATP-binding protein [Roseiarcus sp.]